jgi:superfamily II RNA helicase
MALQTSSDTPASGVSGETLADLAARSGGDADVIVESFTAWVRAHRGHDLYEAQTEALLEIALGSHVIVDTPTGSGKSLVATAALFDAVAHGGRAYYTAPIKALVSERFFELVGMFGPAQVGMLTGDAAVNADAPVICCTAEILANLALRDGRDAPVTCAVMDEFHWFADPQRGWAWQVPLLELCDTRFVLMSATLGDVTPFVEDLAKRTGREVAVVTSATRPVPLVHEYRVETVTDTVAELLEGGGTPAYLVHFTQAGAIERAQALASMAVATRAEKDAIADEIGEFRFAAGFGRVLSRYVRNGIGVHHAGMLPRYRRLVERLAQRGLLKVICGTDTLGVGINVPIRTVVFTALSKYDGERTRLLSAREFHQIGGRAGRAGYDTVGTVIALAPEHTVEKAKAEAKAVARGRNPKNVRSRKPPPGTVSWGRPTFERLVHAHPEPLDGHLRVTHAMVLSVLERPGDADAQLTRLLESPYSRRTEIAENLARAADIKGSLIDAEILVPQDPPDADGRRYHLAHAVQDTFSLDQPLSLFAVAALDLLDPDDPDYALDVVSVAEAVLENPRPVVMSQLKRARSEAIAQMKAEGIGYDERLAELDAITWPQPLGELLEPMFAVYCRSEPWAADHELRPKSVVRDMFERSMDFADYVRFHAIARSEGVLLRYLSDAYRTLSRTIPDERWNDELADLIAWLGELVRQVDSSLIDEWERLRHPDAVVEIGPPRDTAPPPLTANHRAFTVLVRNALFLRVELLARRDFAALGELDRDAGWSATRWEAAAAGYFAEFDRVEIGGDARNPALCVIEERGRTWSVRQIIDDPDATHAWAITAEVDLDASDAEGRAMVTITGLTHD